ncbi:TIGR03885 family FMN-dependent LLM class oxidoreductase [Deinococcus deserti]|uniref:Putative 5,10-methylenetetrahydromethanopterin reductase n=1 Tax=Deinococcus deserti (strain DSM 17065 / CIP 109153 / LMG 22923 / VCD115) TaxID=546414 RepID=C1D3W1_DEIDV|nr:TIGR03885 family FMN-dependent LLM class oxidoreductase [Deinococcus deserti]ACO48190.1 putative 5,10-methylenetetrahydromethanopterin reductase [Deinococcus deserti VCD115]
MTDPTIGFHASHEQFTPAELLRLVRFAEQAGFGAGMCSDHFHPWTPAQGQSGFAWAWMGAALQATSWSFGAVSAPGQRYHPAILAQAAATLAQMFPDRLWCALGSGQHLNEHITGQRWPTKTERNERLLECVQIMRALWRGETVTHRGHVVVEEAKLYTLPARPPLIVGAALTPETARWVGSWADAMITVSAPHDELRQMVEAFRAGGGDGKPMYLQVHLAYAPTSEEALAAAHQQWRANVFGSPIQSEVKTPEQYETLGSRVRPDDMHGVVRISSDVEQHLTWLRQDLDLGFDHLYLHETGPHQERFIEVFGQQVLPRLRGGLTAFPARRSGQS